MENTKKIIFFFLWAVITLSGCDNKTDLKNIRNTGLVSKDLNGKIYVNFNKHHNHPELGQNAIRYYDVATGSRTPITDIINIEKLDFLYKYEEDRLKIKSSYYESKPINNYLKDDKYIYVYKNMDGYPEFFIAGSVDDYEVMGGAYLRVGNKIYWSGLQVNNVDANSFKTINISRKHSEWDATIGKDDISYYLGNRSVTKEEIKRNHYLHE